MAATAHPGPSPSRVRLFRLVDVTVLGGLGGVLRTLSMLVGRRYELRQVTMHVGAAQVCSLRLGVLATDAQLALLLRRLERVPVVLTARRVRGPAAATD